MQRQALLDKLATVERLASNGKSQRLLSAPLRYLTAAAFNRLVYNRSKKPLIKQCQTFFEQSFTVALPAGTDIYLTGGKTHVSELRLARFLIRYLDSQHSYVDVGGHYGYFSGLASTIGSAVTVFEPSPDTFSFLEKNLEGPNVTLHQQGLADQKGTLTFYQFPALYSEYNSLDIEQYANEPWIKDFPPSKVAVPISTLDIALSEVPNFLKIDVEGAEDRVVSGGQKILSEGKTVISMEYLPAKQSNGSHKKATELLLSWGYKSYRLNDDGHPVECHDPEHFLASEQQDSTNLIFFVTPPKLQL